MATLGEKLDTEIEEMLNNQWDIIPKRLAAESEIHAFIHYHKRKIYIQVGAYDVGGDDFCINEFVKSASLESVIKVGIDNIIDNYSDSDAFGVGDQIEINKDLQLFADALREQAAIVEGKITNRR